MNGFVLCANFDIFVLVLVCPKKELNIVVGGVNLDSVLKLMLKYAMVAGVSFNSVVKLVSIPVNL
ncbi:hypothetical protein PHYBLDRAFT_158344 [Phycomyces blakesleeanus NRRL 1555(-)]|uniref:Uncharacterized protein n=1 Tax=Phycomyces blakesleeanus (strain ATCC 8743b / DSM 1359 / FGSC 10004 / NBRC 33097 / NRRL 1555) TaxID=763407 RepID=A0A167N706_PHYB8|nr:hypothetical protein PHYBLDRAFT_158344 [Phycomyces blakesleeanus NRRL 1555(-)]OAD75189.1 hypothetical protein PHYBLDRAFT_158344 [Phycomyces blakesleeanus NRRL 1555(-)]|eukprot:XP_018293229.1 hypothetical protein PHYBLDRAFT_158344 [Phycomyces blakesleeanus NRRL 1555(-)]